MNKIISNVTTGIKEEYEKIYNFMILIKKNIYILWLVLFTAIFSYGYQVTNFAMSIDDERNFSRGAEVKSQLADGRYSCALIHAIFPHNTLPFWYELAFLVLICIVAMSLAIMVYKLTENKVAAAIMAVIFLSMPVHAYSAMFTMECITMPLGYLCGLASIYGLYQWTLKHELRKGIIAVLYAVLMLGFNQSFVPVYISYVCIIIVLTSLKSEKFVWKMILKAISVLLCSLLMYYLINKGIHIWIPERGYVSGYILWGTKSFNEVFNGLLSTLLNVNFYPVVNRGYNTLPILNMIWFLVLVFGVTKLKGKCMPFALGMLGLLLANDMMFIVVGGYISPRSCRAIPVFAGAVVCMLYILADKQMIKRMIAIFTCFIVVYQSSTVVELNYMDYTRQARDLAKVEKVSYEVEKLGLGTIPDKAVAFVNVDESLDGYWYSDNTFALSFFTMGAGRLQSYFERAGYPYQWCTEKELIEAQSVVETSDIPQWPLDGSVVDTGEMIIVNFGAE